MNLSTEQKQIDRENRSGASGKRGGEGKDWEFGVGWCKLLDPGWINNKVPLQHKKLQYLNFHYDKP